MKLLLLFLISNSLLSTKLGCHEVTMRNIVRTILLDGKLHPHSAQENNAPFEGTIIVF